MPLHDSVYLQEGNFNYWELCYFKMAVQFLCSCRTKELYKRCFGSCTINRIRKLSFMNIGMLCFFPSSFTILIEKVKCNFQFISRKESLHRIDQCILFLKCLWLMIKYGETTASIKITNKIVLLWRKQLTSSRSFWWFSDVTAKIFITVLW